jgi:hypothetical protein
MLALGFFNIYLGFNFSRIIFILQGFYLKYFGFLFIIFGLGLIGKYFFKKIYFFGIIPVTILFSIQILSLCFSKDIPTYYQTPLVIGIRILLPFLLGLFIDLLLYFNIKGKTKGSSR